jgi:hypothetical protein
MRFVCDVDEGSRDTVVATFPQGAYPDVRVGAMAEAIFPIYPGRVFTAQVADTVEITSNNEIRIGNDIAAITPSSTELPGLGVILKLDDPNVHLPADAHGEAAVYTDHAQLTGTLRKGLMRIKSLVNYFFRRA